MSHEEMIKYQVPYAWGAGERLSVEDLFPEGLPPALMEGRSRLDLRWRDTTAPAADAWLWLCQIRRAPYSYDLLDNFGRRSPRIPDPAMTEIDLGQSVMTIFSITGFEPGQWFDLGTNGPAQRFLPALAVRYAVIPTEHGSRLAVGMWEDRDRPRRRSLPSWLFTMGDLIMMRKQLITVCTLAERMSVKKQDEV